MASKVVRCFLKLADHTLLQRVVAIVVFSMLAPSIVWSDTCQSQRKGAEYGITVDAPAFGLALLIGNSSYADQLGGDLFTPKNDVEDLCKKLVDRQYRVITAVDLSLEGMHDVIEVFLKKIDETKFMRLGNDRVENRFIIVYYAGHGIQVSMDNYLVPVNASRGSLDKIDATVLDKLFPVRFLLSRLDAKLNLKHGQPYDVAPSGKRRDAALVILDACRSDASLIFNLPLTDSNIITSASGLAKVEGFANRVGLVFSAAYDQLAANVVTNSVSSRNSLFAAKLLDEIDKPQRSIPRTIEKVRSAVSMESDGKQLPVAELDIYWHDFTFSNAYTRAEWQRSYEIAICDSVEHGYPDGEGDRNRTFQYCEKYTREFGRSQVAECGRDCGSIAASLRPGSSGGLIGIVGPGVGPLEQRLPEKLFRRIIKDFESQDDILGGSQSNIFETIENDRNLRVLEPNNLDGFRSQIPTEIIDFGNLGTGQNFSQPSVGNFRGLGRR